MYCPSELQLAATILTFMTNDRVFGSPKVLYQYYMHIQQNKLPRKKDVYVYWLGFLRVSEILILIQSLET
jgi:hypothetical protein